MRPGPELFADAHVLKGAGVGGRMSELAGERFSAFDDGLAPHILLHPLRRLAPRAAGLAPARRTGDRHLHA